MEIYNHAKIASMQFKLISYNIWHGKKWDILLPWLKEQNPDILCLQEVTSYKQNWGDNQDVDLFEVLKQELDLNGVLGKAWHERDEYESYQGCAILTRFPITSHRIHFLSGNLSYGDEFDHDWSREPRVAVEASLDVHSQAVSIYTTHLSYHKYFADDARKLRQATKLHRLAVNSASHTPTLICGDFNSLPKSKVIDLFSSTFTNCLDRKSFRSFARYPFKHDDFEVNTLEYLLDNLFVSDGITCQNIEVPNTAASDHLPIIARLVI
jgi:endonuclease/exonuclease/phosphatase family metal-dependent hydrolase